MPNLGCGVKNLRASSKILLHMWLRFFKLRTCFKVRSTSLTTACMCRRPFNRQLRKLKLVLIIYATDSHFIDCLLKNVSCAVANIDIPTL